MQINRQTYEEFFLLYQDGELTHEQKKAVENFIRENPDLEQEFLLLQDTVFIPDESIVFENKEELFREERKVIAFPWLKIAAAAILIVALTIAGWLFLENKSEKNTQPLASKELIKEVDPMHVDESLTTVEPVVSSEKSAVQSPSEAIGNMITEKRIPVSITVIQPNVTEANSSAMQVNNDNGLEVDPAEPANLTHKLVVAKTDRPDILEVNVAPRDLENPQPEEAVNQQQKIVYVEGDDNNMIYFANTSLPKKSKFRGVFRKASRILDKVTSFQ